MHAEQNTLCNVCLLIDGPDHVQPTTCTYCPMCNAWLCARCARSPLRRVYASFKRWMHPWLVLVPILFLFASPARAQSVCGAGLQTIPAFNVSDNLNKVYQGACWDATNHIITLPLTSLGTGTVTHTGALTLGGPVVGNGGADIKTITGTSGGVVFFASTTTIASSNVLPVGAVVLGNGAGNGPTTSTRLTWADVGGKSVLTSGLAGTEDGQLCLSGAISGSLCITVPAAALAGTLTLPNTTGTLDAGWTETSTTEFLPTSVNFGWTGAPNFTTTGGFVGLNTSGGACGSGSGAARALCAPLYAGQFEGVQTSNAAGNVVFLGTRFQDSTPGGFFLNMTDSSVNASIFSVNTAGAIVGASVSVNQYGTTQNCAGNGTAANPSVVTCANAAPAGVFSCSTTASGGTCQVNTTAVTANSVIFVTSTTSENTRLGVTCNTSPSVVPAVLLASKVAATSFTINMPTITTNPACFDYVIFN